MSELVNTKRIFLKQIRRRSIEQKKIKSDIFNDFAIFLICAILTLVGVLLTDNELFEDQWFFEACADGLFGEENRSLLTLSSNYIVLGLIYLLSFTQVRLNWYSLILIAMNFISSYITCKAVSAVGKGIAGYFAGFTIVAIITTRVFFYFQYTVIATFTATAGCLWLFYSIEYKKNKKSCIFSVAWIVLGASIRVDSVAFPIFFMGLVWLSKIALLIHHNKHEHQKLRFRKMVFRKYFLPFAIALVLICAIELSQQMLMELVNPGFKDWNHTRSLVDDYDIPDYDSHAKEYQSIGLSRNDFQVLRAWNNYDPDFFTKDRYDAILNIKEEYGNNNRENLSLYELVNDAALSMSGSVFLIVGLAVTCCAFIFMNFWTGICCAVILVGTLFLHIYFLYIDRLINRTEYSIWISMLLAMLAAVLVLDGRKESVRKSGVAKCVVVILCIFLLAFRPNPVESSRWTAFCGMSVCDIYSDRLSKSNTLFAQLNHDNINEEHDTYDEAGAKYIEDNKETLFLIANNYDWQQWFPLIGRNILLTSPLNSAENFCCLGQYEASLKPMRKIREEWKIENVFKAMVDENVRVVFKDIEFVDRSREISTYLKEHYYADANFSVEKIINRTVVGRYIRNFDSSDLLTGKGRATAVLSDRSDYAGMACLTISDVDIIGMNLLDLDKDIFLEIRDEKGESLICTLMRDATASSCVALFYNDIVLINSKNISAFLIYEINNQTYRMQIDILN